jgi:hypothetical protein
VIHIRVPDEIREIPLIEITTREQAFVPMQSGLAYIRVKGITFQHAGNGYPPRSTAWFRRTAATTGSSKTILSNGPTVSD